LWHPFYGEEAQGIKRHSGHKKFSGNHILEDKNQLPSEDFMV
jgi:hypothetical protein